MSETTQRASCWSITINNPVEGDYTCQLPAKWSLTGQLEKGTEGTVHYQGMLKTPQVRFKAVKDVFPRAHIEVAKNKVALEKYVHKSETRIEQVGDNHSNIPTLFDYQHQVAAKWCPIAFAQYTERYTKEELEKFGMGEIAVRYVDTIVEEDIRSGMIGVEFIAINPMWRSAWKKFYVSIVAREIALKIKSTEEYIECAPQENTPQNEVLSAESV